MKSIEVVVVGAGPVGLSATIDLARRGIRVMLIDKHIEPAVHPKSRAVNVRTMEIFRTWGVEREVRAAGLSTPPVRYLGIDTVSGWSDIVDSPVVEGTDSDLSPLSPEVFLCSQDILEPILRRVAMKPEVEVRLGTEVESVTEVEGGVRLGLRSRADGSCETIEAAYVVAADGAKSFIRESLGISTEGPGLLQESVSVLFRSNFIRECTGSESAFIYIDNPKTIGTVVMAPVDSSGRVAMLGRPPILEHLSVDEVDWTEQIRLAAGDPNMDFEVIDVGKWEVRAGVASAYRKGRVLLAGDAVHVMPPYGGFNQNTGIQDVHNLGWKLAAVLKGWATPGLLDTYGIERRPVAQFNLKEAILNFRSHVGAEHSGPRVFRPENFLHLGLDLGYRYSQGALVPESGQSDDVWPVRTYTPEARPGARAPHAWLDDAKTLSTLDTFGDGITVLASPGASATQAVLEAASDRQIPARAVGLPKAALDLYGIDEEGVVLVRPDGHVLARMRELSVDTIDRALDALTGVQAKQSGYYRETNILS